MRDGRAEPAFPRAQYFASRGEWEHAHERLIRDGVSYLDENYDPLVDSGRMTLVDGDFEVAPGIWMRSAPGHNRDMMVVTAESGGETFCFLSDLVPTACARAALVGFGVRPLPAASHRNQDRMAVARRRAPLDLRVRPRSFGRFRPHRASAADLTVGALISSHPAAAERRIGLKPAPRGDVCRAAGVTPPPPASSLLYPARCYDSLILNPWRRPF